MARIEWSKTSGIARMSGKLGNLIFYTRGGKQYVKSTVRLGENGLSLDNGSKMARERLDNGPMESR